MNQQTPRAVEDTIQYCAEDLNTLTEVAERFRSLATHYEGMEREGWQLVSPVDQGRMFYARTGFRT